MDGDGDEEGGGGEEGGDGEPLFFLTFGVGGRSGARGSDGGGGGRALADAVKVTDVSQTIFFGGIFCDVHPIGHWLRLQSKVRENGDAGCAAHSV